MEESSQSSVSSKSDVSNDPGKMFIGGLSWQTTAEGLRQHFEKFGELKECVVMRDPITKRSRGFGFLTFTDPKTVDLVLKSGAQELDGKKIDPKLAVPKRAPAKMVTSTKKIFIGGLSTNTTEEDMKTHFGQFGQITETMLMFDKATQRHRGFGFVTFEAEACADKACDTQYHLINNKKVEVKKAQPKEVMYSLQGGRGRAGRGLYGRGIFYPLPGYHRAAGFAGAVPGFGNPFQSMHDYNPAALAYAAYTAAAQQQGRGRGRGRGYLGGYPVAGFPSYAGAYMNPADQRRPSGGHYYAEYATINSSGARGSSRQDMSQLNPVADYSDYQVSGHLPMNGYHQPNYGPPASPVSRSFAPATSPGPVGVSQELGYMSASAGGSGAAELGYSATSPQPAGFGPAMAF